MSLEEPIPDWICDERKTCRNGAAIEEIDAGLDRPRKKTIPEQICTEGIYTGQDRLRKQIISGRLGDEKNRYLNGSAIEGVAAGMKGILIWSEQRQRESIQDRACP